MFIDVSFEFENLRERKCITRKDLLGVKIDNFYSE